MAASPAFVGAATGAGVVAGAGAAVDDAAARHADADVGSIVRMPLPNEKGSLGCRMRATIATMGADGASVVTWDGQEFSGLPPSLLEPLQPFEVEGRVHCDIDGVAGAETLKSHASVLFKLKDFQAAMEVYLAALRKLEAATPLLSISVGSAVLCGVQGVSADATTLRVRPATVATFSDFSADVMFEDGIASLPDEEDAVSLTRLTALPDPSTYAGQQALALQRTLHMNIVRCIIAGVPFAREKSAQLDVGLLSADAAIALSLILSAAPPADPPAPLAAASAGGGTAPAPSPATPRSRVDDPQGTAWYLRARLFSRKCKWVAARASADRAKALLPPAKHATVDAFLAGLDRQKAQARHADRALARSVAAYVAQVAHERPDFGVPGADVDAAGGAAESKH